MLCGYIGLIKCIAVAKRQRNKHLIKLFYVSDKNKDINY